MPDTPTRFDVGQVWIGPATGMTFTVEHINGRAGEGATLMRGDGIPEGWNFRNFTALGYTLKPPVEALRDS